MNALHIIAVTTLLASLPMSTRAEQRILLQSYTAPIPEDAPHYATYLVGTMEAETPLSGDALRRLVEERLSRDAGNEKEVPNARADIERGERQFIEGEYDEAIATLQGARDALLQQPALLAADQNLREPLYRATLFLAHAHLRKRKNQRAIELISETLRSFPDRPLSSVKHAPDLVRLYNSVRRDLKGQRRGSLSVVTRPLGCVVFLNERYVGLSPTEIDDLLPGSYRLYTQRPGKRGRVHLVRVTGANSKINIDFAADHALQTQPYVGLLYASKAEMQQLETPHATSIGRMLDAREVILVGLRRYQGRRSLQGSVVAVATGRPIRSGMIALEPTPPAPEEIKALGRFLLAGEPGTGVIVQPLDASKRAVSKKKEGRGPWPWVTLGLGIAGLGVGIPLIAIDGKGTCSESSRCADHYNTLATGIALTAIGSAALVTSLVLFLRKPKAPADDSAVAATALLPWIGRGAGGLAAAGLF